MTAFPKSDWNCSGCGHQAEDRPVRAVPSGEETEETVPYCANPSCPHSGSIVPNYVH